MREDLGELIDGVSAQLTRTYRAFVEQEDITQELWAFALKAKRIDSLSPWQVRQRLYDTGARYCRKEKATRSGYDPADEVYYSTKLIREMLPYATMSDPVQSKPINDTNKGAARKSAAGGYGDFETVVADMRKAFQRLPLGQRQTLLAYVDGGLPAGKAVTGAIRNMQRKLGGRRPVKWH